MNEKLNALLQGYRWKRANGITKQLADAHNAQLICAIVEAFELGRKTRNERTRKNVAQS